MGRSVRHLHRGIALLCVVVAPLSGSALFLNGRQVEGVWLDVTFVLATLVAVVTLCRVLAASAVRMIERHHPHGRDGSADDG